MRREPFTRAEVVERQLVLGKAKLGELPSLYGDARRSELPSEDELVELAKQAGVPAAEQVDFVEKLRGEIRLFRLNILVSRQEEPSRKAEAARQVAAEGRKLQRLLASLADGYVSGLDELLAEHIHKADADAARHEAWVSNTRSRRQATYYRDDLAHALKALAMTRSAKFAREERAAEKWVATVLKVLKVSFPDPEMRHADFRRMFSVNRKPPAGRVEPHAETAETKDVAKLLNRTGDESDAALDERLRNVTIGEVW
jgi:hypothetical protein